MTLRASSKKLALRSRSNNYQYLVRETGRVSVGFFLVKSPSMGGDFGVFPPAVQTRVSADGKTFSDPFSGEVPKWWQSFRETFESVIATDS